MARIELMTNAELRKERNSLIATITRGKDEEWITKIHKQLLKRVEDEMRKRGLVS